MTSHRDMMVLIVVHLTRPILRLVSRKSFRVFISYRNYINWLINNNKYCDSSSFEFQNPNLVSFYVYVRCFLDLRESQPVRKFLKCCDINAITSHIHLCASKMVRFPSLLYPFSILLIFSSSDRLLLYVRVTAVRPMPESMLSESSESELQTLLTCSF